MGKLIPVTEYEWTDDYSFMRELTCITHKGARFLTKNPYTRSVFAIKSNGCDCSISELFVVSD